MVKAALISSKALLLLVSTHWVIDAKVNNGAFLRGNSPSNSNSKHNYKSLLKSEHFVRRVQEA